MPSQPRYRDVSVADNAKSDFDFSLLDEAVVAEGEELGNLDEVMALFEALEMCVVDDLELLKVEKKFENQKQEPLPSQNSRSHEDSDFFNDPVKLYLKDMGQITLLTRENEVEIAKLIESGEREVIKSIMKTRVGLESVLEIGRKLEAKELRLKDVVKDVEEIEDPLNPDGHGLEKRNQQILAIIKQIEQQVNNQARYLKKVDKEFKTSSVIRRRKIYEHLEKYDYEIECLFFKLNLNKLQYDNMVSRLRDWRARFAKFKEVVNKNCLRLEVSNPTALKKFCQSVKKDPKGFAVKCRALKLSPEDVQNIYQSTLKTLEEVKALEEESHINF
ncbi:MAG: hypothetical protein LBV23_00250, partial [Deltaproteobacteria bacterium]|nr:hypothetical protein [Deltaproteobacteria bacterium]